MTTQLGSIPRRWRGWSLRWYSRLVESMIVEVKMGPPTGVRRRVEDVVSKGPRFLRWVIAEIRTGYAPSSTGLSQKTLKYRPWRESSSPGITM